MHRKSHPVSFPVSFQGQRANEDCVRVRPVSHNNVELGYIADVLHGWLGSRVVSVLDSGAERPGFKSQPRRCRVTVLGKLFTPIMPLFTKQQNW